MGSRVHRGRFKVPFPRRTLLLQKAHAKKDLRRRRHLADCALWRWPHAIPPPPARRQRRKRRPKSPAPAAACSVRRARGRSCLDRRLSEPGRTSRGAHAGGVQQDVLLHRQGTAARHHLRHGHGARKASQRQQQGQDSADSRGVHSGCARPAAAGAGRGHRRHRHRRSHGHTERRKSWSISRRLPPTNVSEILVTAPEVTPPATVGRAIRPQRLRAALERLPRKPRGAECAPHRRWQEAGGNRRRGRKPRG